MAARHVIIGAGPVGTTLALRLAADGHEVRVVTRSGSGPAVPGVERWRADITDEAAAIEACDGATVVYGCANTDYSASAWLATWPKLQAGGLAGARAAGARYVTVDNLYMYGPTDGPRTERTPMAAPGAKGRLRAELAASLFAQQDVPVASVRAGDFFGPFVRGSHVGERFVPRLLAGKRVRVVGDPDAPHAFTYVPDLVSAMVAVAHDDAALGRAWHAPMTTVSQRALAEAIAPAAKVAAYPAWAFSALARVVPMIRELEELRYQFDDAFLVDDTDARTILGLRPTPLAEQVAATVAWWQQDAARAAA